MKKIIRRSAFLGVLVFVFAGVISCEKDFTDIATGVVSNTKFNTKDTILEVLVSNVPIENVRADGLKLPAQTFFGLQGQYLLGTYTSDFYENIDASIVSQININSTLEIATYTKTDEELDVVTTIDTAFIKLPYQATLLSNTDKPIYSLDSVIAQNLPSAPFTLNVYQLDTYLNTLNEDDPSKGNTFLSDHLYQTKATSLTAKENMDFVASTKDTLIEITRKNSLGDFYKKDTIRYKSSITSTVGLPMAIIPLKKSFAKEVFLDNYGTSNFASQQDFNEYFNGIVIEAKRKTSLGALIAFNLNTSNVTELNPAIEVYYTNTFFKKGTSEIDTVISKTHSFQLGGIINNKYNMTHKVYPENNEVVIQGTAGAEAKVEILNGNELTALKAKNWLINDASLSFYINQDRDTTIAPYRLYLYKKGVNNNGSTILSQVKDIYTEGPDSFGGGLQYDNNKKDRYTFRITDYVSDLLSVETNNYNPSLRLKVFNTADLPTTLLNRTIDTIFRRYNWNPRAVSILNGDENANGVRRAQLKISYTEQKN